MPTYEYLCAKGHPFERVQKMTDQPIAKCPDCGAGASRQISGGQGLIFKGSGFYITDYGKDGKGPRKEPSAEGGAAKSDGAAAAKEASSAKEATAAKDAAPIKASPVAKPPSSPS